MAFSNHDVVPDSPINNFATWNALVNFPDSNSATSNLSLSDGNLRTNKVGTEGFDNNTSISNIAIPTTGKWYAEFLMVVTATAATSRTGIGIMDSVAINGNSALGFFYSQSGSAYAYNANGQKTNAYGNFAAYSSSYTNGNIIGVFYDADAGSLTFYKDGANQGTAFTSVNAGNYYFTAGYWGTFVANFGQDPTFGGATLPASAGSHSTDTAGASTGGLFAYQPPAGALALCTKNIPSGPINVQNDDVPSDYMKAVTYAGNGGTNNITDVGFQPDLVWIKGRTFNSSNWLTDSIRGNNKIISSNGTGAEVTVSNCITSFNSDGFSLGSNADFNSNGKNLVAWCWKAAGAPADNQAKIINEDGSDGTMSTADLKTNTGASITPDKVSANRKSGFSIVKYAGNSTAGATIPTGLSSDVDFFIYKALNDSTYAWNSWHRGLTDDYYIQLNTTTGQNNDAFIWDASGMANNVITHGSWVTGANVTGKDYIIYAWHSVAGYSKFGSYVGNGSADGTFVELGFRPAFLLTKCVDASGVTDHWAILDNARDSYNVAKTKLYPNASYAENADVAYWSADFLSNGFKIRNSYAGSNATGKTYIFAAFAEAPMNAPSNAR